ncbi:hypothetical protein PoB_000358400 [Plakobranchus ocellatus]|uniref:Uncharacterized protein n=1 Tax=Plakobranchus ocellatus TaxID=259542 RepID=A0AAV3Y4T1_9GAST|nr:hypothetical protein PoB_000358400 [Plakobranchus ocellatus]
MSPNLLGATKRPANEKAQTSAGPHESIPSRYCRLVLALSSYSTGLESRLSAEIRIFQPVLTGIQVTPSAEIRLFHTVLSGIRVTPVGRSSNLSLCPHLRIGQGPGRGHAKIVADD